MISLKCNRRGCKLQGYLQNREKVKLVFKEKKLVPEVFCEECGDRLELVEERKDSFSSISQTRIRNMGIQEKHKFFQKLSQKHQDTPEEKRKRELEDKKYDIE